MKITTTTLRQEWWGDKYNERYLIRSQYGIMWRKTKDAVGCLSKGFFRISKNGIPFFTFSENGDTEMKYIERTKERNSFVDFDEWKELKRESEGYGPEFILTRDRKNFYVFRVVDLKSEEK